MILHFDTVAVTASCLYSVTLVNPLLFEVWWADLNTTADKVVVTFEATAIDKVHPNEFFYQWGKTSYASMPAWDPRQDVDARFHLDGDLSYPWSTGRHLISVAPVTIASNLVATSLADTPTYYLAIGETATYDVTLTLPESSTNLKTRFQLPKGFGCRNAYVKFIGSSVNDSALAVGQRLVCPPPDSQGRRLIEFAFGQLRVVPDNVRNLNDTIVISVEGQVLDDSTLANNNRLATTAPLLHVQCACQPPGVGGEVGACCSAPGADYVHHTRPLASLRCRGCAGVHGDGLQQGRTQGMSAYINIRPEV